MLIRNQVLINVDAYNLIEQASTVNKVSEQLRICK